MTDATPRILRTADWDWDNTRETLRRSIWLADEARSAGDWRAVAEPLARSTATGLLQSIRIEVRGGDTPLSAFRTRVDGVVSEPVVETGPSGSVRLLVPAVKKATRVEIRLPSGTWIAVLVSPVPQWTIHLVPHSHLDIGFTDPQSSVLMQHLDYLDSVLDLVSATDDWPDSARYRWTLEGAHVLELWLKSRSNLRAEEMIRRIRSGRIELTALPFNLHSEFCSTEELHEHVRRTHALARRIGVPTTSAMQSDVPGAAAGLPGALRAAGVRYLSVAHNWAGRAVPLLTGGDVLPRLFRWSGADGEVIVWSTDSAHGMSYVEGTVLGFTDNLAMVEDLLPTYLTNLASRPFPFTGGIFGWHFREQTGSKAPYPWRVLPLRVQGFLGDNSPPRIELSEIVREWNERWTYPRLQVSTSSQSLDDLVRQVGADLETFSGDWLNWWADGAGSAAMALGLSQRAQSILAEAQCVAAVLDIRGATGEDGSDRVYDALGYFNEHTWGAAVPDSFEEQGRGSGDRMWAWKYAKAQEAHDAAEAELRAALSHLGDTLAAGPAALASVAILNVSTRLRRDLFEIFVPYSVVPRGCDFECRNAETGEHLPFVVADPANEQHHNIGRVLRGLVCAEPLSILRVDLLSSPTAPSEDVPVVNDVFVLENDEFRLRIDPTTGSINSAVFKPSGLDLIDPLHPTGLNAAIYDRYGSSGGLPMVSLRLTASEELEMIASRSAGSAVSLVSRTDDALGSSITYRYNVHGMGAVEATVGLMHGTSRIDVTNRVIKPARLDKEGGYFAFPFNLRDPEVMIDVPGGIAGNKVPNVPGAPSHLFVAEKRVRMRDDEHIVDWTSHDAPLLEVGNIAQPYPPYHPTVPGRHDGTIYSWVFNNVWDTNFPASQRLDFSFRYSISVAARSTQQGEAWSEARPFVATLLRSGAGNEVPPSVPVVGIENADLEVVSFRYMADTGRLRLKLRSRSAVTADVQMTLPDGAQDARIETFFGDESAPLVVTAGRAHIKFEPKCITTISWRSRSR